jgi:prepilin-type N-terminal cleavage/methylation domain-containing protein
MKRSGFTVMELVIGLAVAAILVTVSAAMFQAGIKTYSYTARQNAALKAATTAFDGQGSVEGIVRAAHAASSVGGLSTTSLVLVSTDTTTTFSFSGTTLTQASTATYILSTDISSVTYSYYNIDAATGRLVTSPTASSATLVTAYLKVNGLMGTQKTYSFFTGAQLRNHQ